MIQSSLSSIAALPASEDRPGWVDSAMVLNRRLGWLPSVQNNSGELFHDYDQSIQAKADLVRTAERYVHVEYFMICRDSTAEPFFQALLEVAARGVKVRVLFDHVSTFALPGYKEMLATFDKAGIEWQAMRHPASRELASTGSAQPREDRHRRWRGRGSSGRRK